MKFEKPLRRAVLLRRYKRFLADVQLETGEALTVHCPNPGSMLGCDRPGSPVIISDSGDGQRRKLRWTLEMVHADGVWIGVHPTLANEIVTEAIVCGSLPELARYGMIEREVRYGDNTRFDLRLTEHPERGGRICYVEIKNVTLAVKGTALFPDAQTARGRKHLRELTKIVAEGDRAAMVYCIAREDAHRFAPAAMIDSAYAELLAEAHARGVEILPYVARVKPEGEIRLERRVPFTLDTTNLPDINPLRNPL